MSCGLVAMFSRASAVDFSAELRRCFAACYVRLESVTYEHSIRRIAFQFHERFIHQAAMIVAGQAAANRFGSNERCHVRRLVPDILQSLIASDVELPQKASPLLLH